MVRGPGPDNTLSSILYTQVVSVLEAAAAASLRTVVAASHNDCAWHTRGVHEAVVQTAGG